MRRVGIRAHCSLGFGRTTLPNVRLFRMPASPSPYSFWGDGAPPEVHLPIAGSGRVYAYYVRTYASITPNARKAHWAFPLPNPPTCTPPPSGPPAADGAAVLHPGAGGGVPPAAAAEPREGPRRAAPAPASPRRAAPRGGRRRGRRGGAEPLAGSAHGRPWGDPRPTVPPFHCSRLGIKVCSGVRIFLRPPLFCWLCFLGSFCFLFVRSNSIHVGVPSRPCRAAACGRMAPPSPAVVGLQSPTQLSRSQGGQRGQRQKKRKRYQFPI